MDPKRSTKKDPSLEEEDYGINWYIDTTDELSKTRCESTYGLCQLLKANVHFAKDKGNVLYYYHNGVYKENGRAIVDHGILYFLKAMGKQVEWKSLMGVEAVRMLLIIAKELPETPPTNRINVLNGIVEWDEDKGLETRLLPHTPEFLTTVQLPVMYDPKATCPVWERFLNEVLPPDVVRSGAIWQIIGWLLIPHMSYQLALILTGEGANGKSTFLRAVMALIGLHNCSAVSLHKLEEDKFAASLLVGKLVNMCPDISGNKLTSTSVFKSIVGCDPLLAERKHEKQFTFRPFTRLVFSANTFPQTPDSSEGFYRRFLAIPFPNNFENASPELGRFYNRMLLTPEELSGALNKAIGGIMDMMLFNGINVTESMKAEKREIREATDPMLQWLNEETEEAVEDFYITKAKLYEAYSKAVKRDQRDSIIMFGKKLKKLRCIKEGQKKINGKGGIYVWLGIRFKEDSLFYSEGLEVSNSSKISIN